MGPFRDPEKTRWIHATNGQARGRVIEPVDDTHVRVTMALNVDVPAAIRWVVTDSLLGFVFRKGYESAAKSWNDIIAGFDTIGYAERMQNEAAFYKTFDERLTAHFQGVLAGR